MVGRLVYEVRLIKVSASPAAAGGRKWRWDVTYLKTTDPTTPGVETGREHIGIAFGYERFRWQAKNKIASKILNNRYKNFLVEM